MRTLSVCDARERLGQLLSDGHHDRPAYDDRPADDQHGDMII
jgi:hypothetical protein